MERGGGGLGSSQGVGFAVECGGGGFGVGTGLGDFNRTQLSGGGWFGGGIAG